MLSKDHLESKAADEKSSESDVVSDFEGSQDIEEDEGISEVSLEDWEGEGEGISLEVSEEEDEE